MMHFPLVVGLLMSSYAMASRLYAASYAGTVTELRLSKPGLNYQLEAVSQTTECGTSPSWLMVGREKDILYCLDEAVDLPNGTLSSFRMSSNGSLATVEQLQTIAGPVSSAFYTPVHAPDRQFLALAHYSGSAITTYSIDPAKGYFNRSQTLTFTMPHPGPVPSRQDAPHIHQVLIDPTGRFLLAPDLGADVVRIFYINPTTGRLTEQQPLVASPGSGPRHGVFWAPRTGVNASQNSRFFLVSELDNSITGYHVAYSPNGTMFFCQFYESSSFGGANPPTGSKAAGIVISPGNDRLIVSNRGDNIFGHGNDSIAVFFLPDLAQDDEVSFLGLYPAYGSFPRQFEFSPDGDMLAVALQNSHQVAVIEWDVKHGLPGRLLSNVTLEGEVPAVVWDM